MSRITVVNDAPAHYVPYTSERIRADHRVAFTAAMEVLFSHTADVFECIVDIIAEKYELDVGDMMQTILEHPSYQNMNVHPVIKSLGYFAEATPVAPVESTTKKKIKIIRKKIDS